MDDLAILVRTSHNCTSTSFPECQALSCYYSECYRLLYDILFKPTTTFLQMKLCDLVLDELEDFSVRTGPNHLMLKCI